MFFISTLFSFLLSNSPANALACDSRWAQDSESAKAISFLQSIAGYYDGNSCELSINVCDKYAPSTGAGQAQIGEILLIDKKTKNEFYLPIQFQEGKTQKTTYRLENGRRMFHYEFTDLNPDPEVSSVMTFLFEAVKENDLSRLEYVEFGIRRPTDHRLEWAVCRLSPQKISN